jgi:hypothetical protein
MSRSRLRYVVTSAPFASAVILFAAPDRMAVYDYYAHLGLWRVGLLYGKWTAREVDLALFTHGQHRGFPRPRLWK